MPLKSKPFVSRLLTSMSFLAALMGVVFFGLYLTTMPLVNVGYGDSDGFLAAASQYGILRPPGFPLYSFLLAVMLHLPLGALSGAAKGHLLSVILSAGTIAVTFASLWQVYDVLVDRKRRLLMSISPLGERILLAVIGTFSLGFCSLFWVRGIIAETAALSAHLVAWCGYITVQFMVFKSKRRRLPLRYFIALPILFGLAASHQHMLLLLLLPLAYMAYELRRRLTGPLLGIMVVLAVVSFGIPYAWLWFRSALPPAVSWTFDHTLKGLWHVIGQGDFTRSGSQRPYFTNGVITSITIDQSLAGLKQYLLVLLKSFGWWLVPVGLLAILDGVKRSAKAHIPLWLLWVSIGIGIGLIFTWPTEWGSQGAVLNLYVPGLVVLPLVAYTGWVELLRRVGKFLEVLVTVRTAGLILLPLLGVIWILQGLGAKSVADLRSYTMVSERYGLILDEVKPNALVTCYSDNACFALLYEQTVNHRRPDVDVIPLALPLASQTINKTGIKGFSYDKNPYILLDIISWNLDKRPVYAVELSNYYYNALGLDYPFMYYIPQGYYGELTRKVPASLPPVREELSAKWLTVPTVFTDPDRLLHKSTPARDHILNGTLYNRMNLRDLSVAEFNQAANIYYQFSREDKKQFDGLRASLEQSRVDPRYQEEATVPDSKKLIDQIPELIKNKKNNQAYRAAMAAVVIDPRSVAAHMALADIFERMGDYDFARKEYQHALSLDPQNTEAEKRIRNLAP